jgi:nitrate reductase assembly molybdenum cofactor insertion protein NarJ
MNNELSIAALKDRLQEEYAKYDHIMKSMPEAMDAIEHKQQIAKAHHQRGVLDGLERAVNILREIN